MKVQPPTAAQKRWREQVRDLGSIISGRRPVEIHHCAGRAAVHNKVHVGHWWILPLTSEEHRELHADPERKRREKNLFQRVLERWLNAHPDQWLPLPHGVTQAIEDYHR